MPFIDLHAHFPMHTRFPPGGGTTPSPWWKKALFQTVNRTLNYERGRPRVSLDRWFDGDERFGVTGVGSALYDPEDEFFVATGPEPIPDAIEHVCHQLAHVEHEIGQHGSVRIARSPREVEHCLQSGQRFVFHTLEGGFGCGGDITSVTRLSALGVASIIPAHLLYRGVATCEDGFPPPFSLLFRRELERQPPHGLSSFGEKLVEACFQQGLIVDITHARADAQARIFEIGRTGYPHRPIISSHNSVRRISDAPLNLSDEALGLIKESGGVVGVIFSAHWLRRQHGSDARDDMALVTDVIDHIHSITESYEHVAIGSDLDGFIEPIPTCSNYSKMSALARHLTAKYGPLNAEKILYRNALRVLHKGWTGVSERPERSR